MVCFDALEEKIAGFLEERIDGEVERVEVGEKWWLRGVLIL